MKEILYLPKWSYFAYAFLILFFFATSFFLPIKGARFFFIFLSFLVLLYMLATVTLFTKAEGDQLVITFKPLGLISKTFNRNDIVSIEKVDISPIWRFKGYGFVYSFKGEIGYIASSNSFVKITTRKNIYIVSTNDPESYISWQRGR